LISVARSLAPRKINENHLSYEIHPYILGIVRPVLKTKLCSQTVPVLLREVVGPLSM
jgi:hypothetical protein